jgi:hypothetical protein
MTKPRFRPDYEITGPFTYPRRRLHWRGPRAAVWLALAVCLLLLAVTLGPALLSLR